MRIAIENSALMTGLYDGDTLIVQSTIADTEIVDGLTATKTASKTLWAGGTMTYTITIANETDVIYSTPTLIDDLDEHLTLVEGTVKYNGTVKPYTFENNRLSVVLETIPANSSGVVTFDVAIATLP